MNIEFTGRGTDITDSLKQYATDKLKKISRFVDNIVDVSVTFSVEKHRHMAEIKIKAGQDLMVAKETTDDMYMSINGALDKIEKQAKKLKTRMTRKRKDAPAASVGPVKESQEPRIVPMNVTNFKPMTVDEAIMELEAGPNPFVIFQNHEMAKDLTVVFAREDGLIGIVTLG